MNGPLAQYCKRHQDDEHPNWYSQHGEYGILEYLFNKLGIDNGWCFEAGACDGKTISNTFQFVEAGWPCVMAEELEVELAKSLDYEPHWESLDNLAATYPNLHVFKGSIGRATTGEHRKTIDDILDAAGCAPSMAVMSLDIEGDELVLWEMMERHKARVVIIEIDSGHANNMDTTVAVGKRLGYSCVAHCGNLVFVMDEDLEQLEIYKAEIEDFHSLFTPNEPDWSV